GAHRVRDPAPQDGLSGNSGVRSAGWVRGRGSPRAKAAQKSRVTKRDAQESGIDLEASGLVCAVKRGGLIRAKDQRTTSGPADTILRAKGRRHDRTHDLRNAEN